MSALAVENSGGIFYCQMVAVGETSGGNLEGFFYPGGMQIEALIQGLCRGEAFPGGRGEEVEVLQTHISVLFFVGDRVYKLKKPVDLGFLDYSSLEARRFFCEEEVRLGRELAPSVYLGVLEIREEKGGLRVGGGSGEVCEFCVAMKRLPEERMMDHLVREGTLEPGQLSALVDLLVDFHGRAATGEGVDAFGAPGLVWGNCEENFAQSRALLREDPERVRHLRALDQLEVWSRRCFEARRGLLEKRVREHRIREGHGDLHAGNICFLEEGVVVYDRIEFNLRFRCLDVASEMAFLGMDLDHEGARELSRRTMRAYAERAGDPQMLELLPFYKTYRAMVRAKVALFRAHEAEVPAEERERSRQEFLRYLGLGLGYHLRGGLVLLCGLPGSGKTAVAEALAELTGARVFHSDQLRKELAGLGREQSAKAAYGEGIYGSAQSEATYAALLEACRVAVAAPESAEGGEGDGLVIADAGFPSRARRRPFVQLAKEMGVPLLCVHLAPDMATLEQRVRAREARGPGLSDAGLEVLRERAMTFEPPEETETGALLRLGQPFASLPPTEAALEILLHSTPKESK